MTRPAIAMRDENGPPESAAIYRAWDGRYAFPEPSRPGEAELFLVTAGEGRRTVTVSGTTRVEALQRGWLAFVRPDDGHSVVAVGAEGLTVCRVAFPVATWVRFALTAGIDQRPFAIGDPLVVRVDPADSAIRDPFERILAAARHDPTSMDLLRFLADIVPWFTRADGLRARSGMPTWLRSGVAAMQDEGNLRGGVARFAELCHVSRTQLWRASRTHLGIAPSQLIASMRARPDSPPPAPPPPATTASRSHRDTLRELLREPRALSFREAMARTMPGMPYWANHARQPPTGRYRPDHVELFLVTGGAGHRVAIADDGARRITPLLPGRLLVFRPLDVQELIGLGETGVVVFCVAFPFETWQQFALSAGLDLRPYSRPDPPEIHVDLDDPRTLRPFEAILEAFRARPDPIDLVRFLAETIPWFEQRMGASDRADPPAWLWSAVTAMHQEPHLRAGVGRLAELSHVSYPHLWRNVRSHFGCTPSELVTRIRLAHAARLLASTDEAISIVAERCGFSSPAQFSRVFRRGLLTSPRAYRLQSRK